MNGNRYFKFLIRLMLLVAMVSLAPSVWAETAEEENGDGLLEHFMPEKWIGDFSEMVKHREVRILVVHSNTFYFLDKGQQKGATYEAGKQFEAFVNKKLGSGTLKVKVVFLPVNRDELLPMLVEGYGDIAAANLTITPERQKQVDFSQPVYSSVSEVAVTSAKYKSLNTKEDLAGETVYVRKSSSYYESLLALNKEFEKQGKPLMTLEPADEWLEDEDLLEMVNADLIPVVIVDSHKASFWAQVFDNIKIHENAAVRTEGKIGWAFRKNSPELEQVVNEFVAKNKKGTLTGNIILNRYLKNADYIKNSLAHEEIEKFKAMVELFAVYGDKYNFDFLMLVAQGYQESGLDQSKKSSAGAIGIMQVLSSTAKDPSVNISDIHILENNIHAGTKYMRFLYDRYYKDEPMEPLDKMLFTFASYNAGPAKIRRIRNTADKMGLDGNVWFQNAEIAAAKVIGRETVQYVSHIYKYYLAYKMLYTNSAVRDRWKKKYSGPETKN